MINQDFFEIVTTVIEAAVTPELWNKAIDLTVDGYGGRSGNMIVLDPDHTTRTALAMSRFMRIDAFESYQRFMRREDTDDTTAIQKIYELDENRICSEYELFNASEYRDMPHSGFRDWMRDEFDIVQRYGVKLNQHGPWLDCMLLHTDSQKNLLSAKETGEINNLSLVISSSLKTFRVMEQLKAQFNVALSALDQLGIACFLTTENATVMHRNQAALELLQQSDGVYLDNRGRLKVSETEATMASFSKACLEAFRTANAEAICNEAVISVTRPSHGTDYLLTINPVVDSIAELSPGLRCALVFIVDPDNHKSLSIEGLIRLGELTASEAAVCQMLVDGRSTREIMELRSVTENTARQQIKTILRKLSCRNRVDLLRLAVDTHLPLKESK